MKRKINVGFTLAELLIALALLGVVATFTIPKVLQSQQDQSYKAKAKEAAGSIAAAYSILKQNNLLTSNTRPVDLTPYLNYTSVDTSTSIDWVQTAGSLSCTATEPCYKLHNGGTLRFMDVYFSGTGTTNAIYFDFDPDGVNSGSTSGPGKSVEFVLYYTGRLTTYGAHTDNTVSSAGTRVNAIPAYDPSWFGWN
jgi:prepilin-type N-terminal cleavage/methylation domain-containing protein